MSGFQVAAKAAGGSVKEQQKSRVSIFRYPAFYYFIYACTVTAQYIFNFMCNHFFNRSTCRTKILTWVKVFRMFVKVFTDGTCHCQTQIGINVNFANCHFSSFTQHIFRNTDCIPAYFRRSALIISTNSGDNGRSTVQVQLENPGYALITSCKMSKRKLRFLSGFKFDMHRGWFRWQWPRESTPVRVYKILYFVQGCVYRGIFIAVTFTSSSNTCQIGQAQPSTVTPCACAYSTTLLGKRYIVSRSRGGNRQS